MRGVGQILDWGQSFHFLITPNLRSVVISVLTHCWCFGGTLFGKNAFDGRKLLRTRFL